jgi:hypothetical protein
MFKKTLAIGAIAFASLFSSTFAAYAQVPAQVPAAAVSATESAALSGARTPIVIADVSPEEAAALSFMREEEKLAHDVYITLYEQWDLAVFQNIAESEQTHTDSVKTLLDRYNLPDPAANTAVGEFTDPALQALYDQLVADGSESLEAALKVGAAIEEIDILDLEERAAITDNADILQVYENLTKGSRNHLRSFTSTLETVTGEVYVPQYLPQAEYDAIVNSEIERGGRGR